jgi:hypothetical protein
MVTKPETRSVSWLHLPSYSQLASEKLEYSIKGPLYAASCVLDLSTNSSSITNIHAKAQASLALGKRWQFEAESSGDLNTQILFEQYLERDLSSHRTNSWKSHDAELIREGGRTFDLEQLSIQNAAILSSIQLPFAIAYSWSASCDELRGYFVAAKSVHAIQLIEDGQDAGLYRLAARVRAASLSGTDWEDSHWSADPIFYVHVNSEKRVIESISAKAPVIGQVKLKLTRHERSPS